MHQTLAVALGFGARAWHYVLNPKSPRLSLQELTAVQERFDALLRADVANVAAGHYPRELLFQFPIARYLSQVPAGMRDMPRVLRRKAQGRFDDLPADVDLAAFPGYYRRNFHWQTDGWLSERSARLYDVSVEFLFLGTADMMRRMAIVPLVEHLGARSGRVLDLACGTGRFLGQLHRARPDLELWGLDLSPWYLAEARRTLRRAGTDDVHLLAANAEESGLPDGHFDAVTSVFLFHELPRDVRRRVMSEAFRLLRPGGIFTVCDSAQLKDSGHLATHLTAFPGLYHEPYYKGYLRDPLEDALGEVGFEVLSGESPMVSKVVVGRRPPT